MGFGNVDHVTTITPFTTHIFVYIVLNKLPVSIEHTIIKRQTDINTNKRKHMNRCSKTGLTDTNYKTILDVLNMYDPNDVAKVYPSMATPDFMQQVQSAFRAVLAHVERINEQEETLNNMFPDTIDDKPAAAPVDPMSLAYKQYIHDS